MTSSPKIIIWNRVTNKYNEEMIFSESALRLLYSETKLGKLLRASITKKWFNQIYGAYYASKISVKDIAPFIEKFNIQMNEFKNENFKSFNDFFIREFKPTVRKFVSDLHMFPAFTEGRYYAFDKINNETLLPIKGAKIFLKDLFGGHEVYNDFTNGPGFIARLCPTDYHRYHYPDDGNTITAYRLKGRYHSVSPIALSKCSDILYTNERRISLLKTNNFGKLAMIEVGALTVGKIIQTHNEQMTFSRGDEKGYFLFGGSTVILIGQSGLWKPDQDLVEKTNQGVETFIQLGSAIASNRTLPNS